MDKISLSALDQIYREDKKILEELLKENVSFVNMDLTNQVSRKINQMDMEIVDFSFLKKNQEQITKELGIVKVPRAVIVKRFSDAQLEIPFLNKEEIIEFCQFKKSLSDYDPENIFAHSPSNLFKINITNTAQYYVYEIVTPRLLETDQFAVDFFYTNKCPLTLIVDQDELDLVQKDQEEVINVKNNMKSPIIWDIIKNMFTQDELRILPDAYFIKSELYNFILDHRIYITSLVLMNFLVGQIKNRVERLRTH